MDKFIELLRAELERRLSIKTGWGRVEVMSQFDRASIQALIAYAKEKNIPLD